MAHIIGSLPVVELIAGGTLWMNSPSNCFDIGVSRVALLR